MSKDATSSVLSNLGRRLFCHDHFTLKKPLLYIDIHNSQIIRATLVTNEMDQGQEADQEWLVARQFLYLETMVDRRYF